MKDEKLIRLVAEEISNLLPDCCGVTLGGSRCHNLEDEHSDVEMYFYVRTNPPSFEELTECLTKLNAKHKRCDSFLWNNTMPWGPHSFFVIDDLYFEIGYRNIYEIKERILNYINGNVEPLHDCHDLGLGYMPSGLASSIIHEKPLIKCNEELYELKKIALNFSKKLLTALKEEYFDTANSLLDGKLDSASNRGDIFLYEVISTRIVRCLMVMAFALGNEHFPGDKWNEKLLLQTNWSNSKEFLDLLKEHILYQTSSKEEFIEKRKILKKAFDLVKNDLEK